MLKFYNKSKTFNIQHKFQICLATKVHKTNKSVKQTMPLSRVELSCCHLQRQLQNCSFNSEYYAAYTYIKCSLLIFRFDVENLIKRNSLFANIVEQKLMRFYHFSSRESLYFVVRIIIMRWWRILFHLRAQFWIGYYSILKYIFISV